VARVLLDDLVQDRRRAVVVLRADEHAGVGDLLLGRTLALRLLDGLTDRSDAPRHRRHLLLREREGLVRVDGPGLPRPQRQEEGGESRYVEDRAHKERLLTFEQIL